VIRAEERREILRRGVLFSQLSPQEIDEVARLAVTRRFDPEQLIFTKGSPPDRIFTVLQGRVRVVTYSDEGNELIFRFIEPGEVFGEIGLLDGKERTATAIAHDASALDVIQRARFMGLLERRPALTIKLLSALAGRLRTTSELLEDTLFLNVPARLAKKLLELADSYGRETPQGTRIEMALPQHLIGNLIGTSRVSVNQQLGIWKECGWIRLERSRVTLLDREQLEQVAARLDEPG
jgi:CRP-like cAMP-binding protein